MAHVKGRSKIEVERVRCGIETVRIVTAVVAAARVPASSTSTRARCRMRPSAFLPGPSISSSRSWPGSSGRSSSAVELERARRGEARELDRALAERATRRRATRRASPRSAGRARAYGSRTASSACSKRASTRIIGTSPTPSNGAGRVSSNGCRHLRVEVLGVGDDRDLVLAELLEDARDHPVRLLVRPRVDRVEVERPGVQRELRPGRVVRRAATRPARRGRPAPPAASRVRLEGAPGLTRRALAHHAQRTRAARTASRRRHRRADRGACPTGCREAPARARWPRTAP